jgi:hypothetical protein
MLEKSELEKLKDNSVKLCIQQAFLLGEELKAGKYIEAVKTATAIFKGCIDIETMYFILNGREVEK